jgi:hypothetical protein
MYMQTNLVLQSFGRASEYNRAILTILSYYAFNSLPKDQTCVLLFTDNPSYFTPFVSELPIEFILLTPEKIKEMRGSIDFLHRMKIALIEEAFARKTGTILYADSDTFFTKDPAPLFSNVSQSNAYMHLLEYPFVQEVEDKTPTYKKFYQLISKTDFELTHGRRLSVTSQHCSWNAGVMVFHPSHARFIPDVYKLTDQFFPASGSHASEQYAFSLVLQTNLHLEACDAVIYHYWYRVKKQIIDQFLGKHFSPAWALKSINEKLVQVKLWTNELPAYFEKHEWMIRDHAIQAFNEDRFTDGLGWAVKALIKKPWQSGPFLKDVFYHTKRRLIHNSW